MTDLPNRLRALADLEETDPLLLHEAADLLEELGATQVREGTAANYLQHRLPEQPFTAYELASAMKMNLRTVQQAIADLRRAGVIRHCGYRHRGAGKGKHPWLYSRCE